MAILRDPQRPISLYFNLTNACNSACSFCAAGCQHALTRRDIPTQGILNAFDRLQLKPGDEVILNGGEPTLYKGFVDLVHTARSRGAQVVLFTNGRLLRKRALAQDLLEAGISRLSIPLHGRCPETHDRLTGRSGSWQQTLEGIHNVFALRAEHSYSVQIELKLLAVSLALPEWSAVIELLARESLCPDVLVLSGLNMWSQARHSYNLFTPTIVEMQRHVNEALECAYKHRIPISLWSIPLCLLHSENQLRFAHYACSTSSGVSDNTQYIYFDPDVPDGLDLPSNELSTNIDTHTICTDCQLAEICGPGRVFMQQIITCSM